MMRPQLWKLTGTLLLAASHAFAQQSALGGIFDGRGKADIRQFETESVLPVIRGTKESTPPKQTSVLPVVAAGEGVPVAVELLVPAAQQAPQAVAFGVVRLANSHGFRPDTSFDPVRIREFQIMPYPPLPNQRVAYLIRGEVPAAKLAALKQDPGVRTMYSDRSSDTKGLQETVFRYGDKIRALSGVAEVYVGFDCGVKEEHQHVLPHHPAIVVVLDGSVRKESFRQELFAEMPPLANEPVVFVQK